MNIFSYVVIKNEADRYLFRFVEHIMQHVDGLLIYDDGSEDLDIHDINKLVGMGNVHFVPRPPSVPSFMENEARCRQAAWDLMASYFTPHDAWILVLDADEKLRTLTPLKDQKELHVPPFIPIICPIHEMWTETERRTDGFWGKIEAPRLTPFGQGATFQKMDADHKVFWPKMGGGSIPSNGPQPLAAVAPRRVHFDILHFGYSREQDRIDKYRRYAELGENSGHNPGHIRSILGHPVLAPLPQIPYDRR